MRSFFNSCANSKAHSFDILSAAATGVCQHIQVGPAQIKEHMTTNNL